MGAVYHNSSQVIESDAAYNRLRRQSPVFWAGVPDALDDIVPSCNNNAATALYETAKMLLDRTGNNAIQEYCTTECLKHVFVSWLQVYQGISQNSMRHLASWWLYQEWHQQLEFDVQGFPNQFLGKSYEEHVQRAADMMDHTVAIGTIDGMPACHVSTGLHTQCGADAGLASPSGDQASQRHSGQS